MSTGDRRRGRGEGLIRQRADGRWEGRLDFPTDNGRRARKVVYGRSRTEVAGKIRALLATRDAGLAPIPERLTTGDFLEHWLTVGLPGAVRPATADNYRSLARRHIIPVLGRRPLGRLSPEDVERLLRRKADQGLSLNTVRLIRSILRRALRHAERRGQVSRNVAALVDGPRVPRPEGKALTVAQVHALIAAVADDRIGPLYAVLIELGLRRGEALGLTWADFDLEAGTVTVRRTLSRLGGHLRTDEPKTPTSRRTLYMSPPLTASLRQHRRQQLEVRLAAGPVWTDTGFVFTTASGGPVAPANFRRHFRKTLATAGIEGTWRVHELRHSAASLLLAQGVPLHVVSELLGHASIRVTKDVYGHLVAADKERAAQLMGSLLSDNDHQRSQKFGGQFGGQPPNH